VILTTDWQDTAKCIGQTAIFFATCNDRYTKDNGTWVPFYTEERVAQAKAICSSCPVRSQCLDFAIATRTQEGVWGGTEYGERRKIMRQMRKNGETVPHHSVPRTFGFG
jgi:Transcription factor WhiB